MYVLYAKKDFTLQRFSKFIYYFYLFILLGIKETHSLRHPGQVHSQKAKLHALRVHAFETLPQTSQNILIEDFHLKSKGQSAARKENTAIKDSRAFLTCRFFPFCPSL